MQRRIVEDVVCNSGLWDGAQSYTHGFILSPSVFSLTQQEQQTLTQAGQAIHECLSGLGRIAAIACNPQLGSSKTWGMISGIVRSGIPRQYHAIQILKPGRTPLICKVDYMLGKDGNFYIAEIDGHNKHGLGYATLAGRMRHVLAPKAKIFPGPAKMIGKLLAGQKTRALTLLSASQEVFYNPEFAIFKNELAKNEIDLNVVTEDNWSPSEKDLLNMTLVDLPFMYHNNSLNKLLVRLYQEGKVNFLIPPKPFLGSKAMLALLRNDEKNNELEAILRAHISDQSLSVIRKHIPETYLVRKEQSFMYWQAMCQQFRFVLKESISSGMKGTAFGEEKCFEQMLSQAYNSNYRFVLQREVENKPRIFQSFNGRHGDNVEENEWYMRITVHYSVRQIADVTVTARRDKKAHGAKDCIQLGTVIQ